ncbi:MAG: hypothetical protein JXX29_06230 [Deltaproteobacteria bacterium]|nr:hypothetical protein [Deltaproteobacteria bacterium]MBN2671248.1 hypothetical protein [Deltaproteobacteria bacterium]
MSRFQKRYIIVGIIFATSIAIHVSAQKKRPSAGDRVVDLLTHIENTLQETKYQHVTRVNKRKGIYLFDCSGMAAWVLKRTAPAALQAVGRPNDRRPLAVHFYQKIARIHPGKKRGPWYRVPTAAHIRPGDVIAWKRPPWFRSSSTGHVAFAVEAPKANHGEVPGILVRIADASKFKHEADSRDASTTGFGTGVLLLPTNRKGDPLGYGWIGSQTQKDWVIPADLVIGRPLR